MESGTKYGEIFAALAAPFEPGEVKQRTQAGRTFHYVTARSVMNRLDAVLGPENWWDDYHPGQHSVLCRLTICLPGGEVLTKCDAGGYAGMQDQGDDDKSGFSDAFKRAAVKFGVSRYLYLDGVPDFVRGTIDNVPHPPARQAEQRPQHQQQRQGSGPAPRSGRALFAWAKEQEGIHGKGLIDFLNGWAKHMGYPARMVDFDAEQTAAAYAEACEAIRRNAGEEAPVDEPEGDEVPF